MCPDPPGSHRPLLSATALWLVPVIVVMDSLFAVATASWRPNGTIEHVLLAFFGLWFASLALLGPKTVRNQLGRNWRELLLVTVLSLVGWAGLEWGAHVVEQQRNPHAPFHTRGANLHDTRQLSSHHVFGISGVSHFTTGPRGIRAANGPTPEQATRILCIGGSTTECVYLDDNETWPALLEKQLNTTHPDEAVWIGNVGISGFHTREHLQFVQESPLLNDTAVLVVQPGINDLWRFLAGEELHTNFGRFESAKGPSDEKEPAPAYRPLWTRSRVIQLYHTLNAAPPPLLVQEGIGGMEYQIRRERRAAATLVSELPALSAGLSAYRERITALIDESRERGVAILFTTQPVLWQDNLPPDLAARCWFGWLPDDRYLTLGALRRAMDHYNTALLDVCREYRVPCVDLSPMNGHGQWFYDDCHFTEAGAVEVAHRITPVLSTLLEEPSR